MVELTHIISDATIYAGVIITLLLLLLGTHIHSYMVRTGFIPQSIPRPKRHEFDCVVDEILFHEEFLKLKEYNHHTNHIYDHVVRVAYISYVMAKVLGLDYIAAARGGLLHDFFLYDWRERKSSDSHRSLHGKEHPHIALANARKHFDVNDREADIIVKHMYPKTRALPRYKESVIVSLADKLATIVEYIIHFFTKKI